MHALEMALNKLTTTCNPETSKIKEGKSDAT